MIREIEMIEYLLQEIKDTEIAMSEWDKDYEKAKQEAIQNGRDGCYNWQYRTIKESRPPKSTINNNIKKIRKLLLKMYV